MPASPMLIPVVLPHEFVPADVCSVPVEIATAPSHTQPPAQSKASAGPREGGPSLRCALAGAGMATTVRVFHPWLCRTEQEIFVQCETE